MEREVGKLPHALLLYGEAGLGKRTLARLVACRMMLPENPQDSDWAMILENRHPDLVVLNGGIKVDDVRELLREVSVKPHQADRRVCILEECDSMTHQAQNALLKTLEEPPEGSVFILTAKSRERLLPTILSRVQAVRLVPVSPEECGCFLSAACQEHSEEERESATKASGGNIGMALALLGEGNIGEVFSLAVRLLDAVLSRDTYGVLALFEQAKENREKFSKTCEILSGLLEKRLMDAAQNHRSEEILIVSKAIRALQTAAENAAYNPNLAITAACLSVELTGRGSS